MILNYLNIKNILQALLLFVGILWISHELLSTRTDPLIHERYNQSAKELHAKTKALIDAKQETVLFIALTLANDDRYKKAVLSPRDPKLHLRDFSHNLAYNTKYKNVWIQLSDANGISRYRSWTKKRGDDITKARKDIVEMIQNPKIRSTISTGIFDMTFKAMVPIFAQKRFIGTIEVIAKFNSLAEQLVSGGVEPVILVDKSYREQIKKPFSKMFVEDYYVANVNASKENRAFIESYGVSEFVKANFSYIADAKNNRFITIYTLKDIEQKPMGYFALFTKLDAISLKDIHFVHYSTLAFIAFLLLGGYLVFLLISAKHKKEKTQLQNELLEKEIEAKNSELAEQHQFLQDVINSIDESIMVIDREYNVLLCNDAAYQFEDNRFTKNENTAKCYQISHHLNHPCDSEAHPCPINETFATEKSVKMIHEHKHADGETHFVELSTTPLYNSEGELYAIIEIGHNITEHLNTQHVLQQQKDELNYQAHYDSLTALPNRVLFFDRLEHSIEIAKRYGNKVVLIFIDLDHFKEINDSLGHDVGDEVLKETAKRLQANIRSSDTVSRLGGDEFTMILDRVNDEEEIVDSVQKLLTTLQKPHIHKDNKLYSGASIGISIYPDNGDSAQELLRNADAAMYKAKEKGRNTYCFYTQSMTQKAYERIVLETEIREAIKKKQFSMYYQPQVNINTGDIQGYEALVRWIKEDGEIVSPIKFIPIAEQTGLIIDIGKLILEEVFTQSVRWVNAHLGFEKISINISMKQLQDPDFVPTVQRLLEQTKCEPKWVEFEITESFIIEDIQEAVRVLNAIRAMDIDISLDDFGTGYSSLSYLKKLPINKLKIDKSFIDDIPDDENDKTITKTIINLAKNMSLEVIAEGVETKEQEEFLKMNGCALAQGYYYAKPIPAEDVSNSNS